MYLIYLDEVKLHPPDQRYQWLCGLAFPDTHLIEIETELSSIAKDYFGSSLLGKESEFHAKQIVHGSGPYKGHPIELRIALFKDLLKVIDTHKDIVKKIEVRIDPELIQYPKDIAQQAFMFFVEKADGLMKSLNSLGLLIADSDPTKNSSNVNDLSFFRSYSTQYAFSKKIENLVDTVHSTHSHHSRFLQLADVYAYSCALCSREQDKYFQKSLKDHIKTTTILKCDKYKYWPTTSSFWLRQ